MKKLTSLAMACIFAISCLTSCSRAEENSDNVASSTTTVTTVTTTTPPVMEPEKKTTTSVKETTTTESSVTKSETKTTTESTKEKITTTKDPGQKVTTTTAEPKNSNRVILPVKNIQQLPEFPAGCEITSATIVLNYLGFNVSKLDMVKYLKISEKPDENNVWYNPREYFLGSPYNYKYGCYEPVLANAIEEYFKANSITDYSTESLTGKKLNQCLDFVNRGFPVIIWATVEMVDTVPGDSWKLKTGETYTWKRHEHCLVVIGYDLDKNTVILSDPFDSRGTVEYPFEKVENAFNQLEQQALIIYKEGTLN